MVRVTASILAHLTVFAVMASHLTAMPTENHIPAKHEDHRRQTTNPWTYKLQLKNGATARTIKACLYYTGADGQIGGGDDVKIDCDTYPGSTSTTRETTAYYTQDQVYYTVQAKIVDKWNQVKLIGCSENYMNLWGDDLTLTEDPTRPNLQKVTGSFKLEEVGEVRLFC